MTIVWNLIKAFLVGGALCMIGEILLLKTKLTPARSLVGYIVAGVFLSAIGVYAPLAQFAGAGASVPLTGFGHALVTGVKRAVQEIGFLGAFTGGLTNTAAGISAGLWLVCEIIVDIGSVHEMSVGLFSAAATLGALGFSFALGLGLAALVCRLLRRKQLV